MHTKREEAMEFLRDCARSIDEGEDASLVLERMRDRFHTVQCMNVKTCLVRQLCTPTDEYTVACRTLLEEIEGDTEMRDLVNQTLERHGKPPQTHSRKEELVALLRPLPPRLSANARSLRVTRKEMLECKGIAA